MAEGAYGQRLGEFVGVEDPPTIEPRLFQNSTIAVTRLTWDEKEEAYSARMAREDAFLLCLQLRDFPSHPYWVDGRAVPIPEVREGQFTLLDLNLEHASHLRDPLDCLTTYVTRATLDSIAEEHGAQRIASLHISPGVPVDDLVVRSLNSCLLPALQRPEQASRLFLDSVATALLAHIAHTYGGMQVAPVLRRGGLAPWQQRRATDALTSHIDGNISLEQLAGMCGLSRSHFARAFKKSTGLPPHRWLLSRRVERVKDMLQNSTLPLEEIARSCGFADPSHLNRVFVAFAGVSPGKWRRTRRL